MSPRLLYLLIARRTHHALKGDRDRMDAQRQPTPSRCPPRPSARQAASVPPNASAQSRGDSQLQGRPPEQRGPQPRAACTWVDRCDMGPICLTVPA
jgi:hypothetical protein